MGEERFGSKRVNMHPIPSVFNECRNVKIIVKLPNDPRNLLVIT